MKIISGGQTGADRAGLDAAAALGLATGGQAPSGYWTERGRDDSLCALGLTAGGTLSQRTGMNVAAADATIVFATHASPGSNLTVTVARARRKPVIVVNPWASDAPTAVDVFLRLHRPAVLNIAGHRESKAPGMHARVTALLTTVLAPYAVSSTGCASART